MILHSPFICDICNLATKRKVDLVDHMKRKHLQPKKTWSTKKSHKRITRITWSKYRQDRKYQNQVPERPESNQVIRMLPLDQLQTSLTTGMPLLMQKCVNLKKNWRKRWTNFRIGKIIEKKKSKKTLKSDWEFSKINLISKTKKKSIWTPSTRYWCTSILIQIAQEMTFGMLSIWGWWKWAQNLWLKMALMKECLMPKENSLPHYWIQH